MANSTSSISTSSLTEERLQDLYTSRLEAFLPGGGLDHDNESEVMTSLLAYALYRQARHQALTSELLTLQRKVLSGRADAPTSRRQAQERLEKRARKFDLEMSEPQSVGHYQRLARRLMTNHHARTRDQIVREELAGLERRLESNPWRDLLAPVALGLLSVYLVETLRLQVNSPSIVYPLVAGVGLLLLVAGLFLKSGRRAELRSGRVAHEMNLPKELVSHPVVPEESDPETTEKDPVAHHVTQPSRPAYLAPDRLHHYTQD